MKILTFNIRNRYGIKNYVGIYKGIDTVKNLRDYIMLNDIDIVCLQEVIEAYRDNLSNILNTYYVYGKPRLGENIFTFLSFAIVTNILGSISKYFKYFIGSE